MTTKILITGAAGMVGQELVSLLDEIGGHDVLATDLREPSSLPASVRFRKMDITTEDPALIVAEEKPDVIIHLASIVNPPKGSGRALAFAVDVEGTRKILEAAIQHKVRRFVVTSSGAAYGYHADNPVPLQETDALRGNPEFAYADHKRLVEEMLAEYRKSHPALEQVIFRVGTVLGKGTENQITALFHRKKLLGIQGSESPFVFIWTRDLAHILARAIAQGPAGIFNVAGDGTMGLTDLARVLNKPVLRLPAWGLKGALAFAKPFRLSQYGPEQVGFLQYRPVLDNRALKEEFGYIPQKSSEEVFEFWRQGAGL
ncbi:MAG: SDR family oxidoreductase [Sneathiellales bacterium]|nr:SDR family oxidoreductase [Sneathiellales bacterium]